MGSCLSKKESDPVAVLAPPIADPEKASAKVGKKMAQAQETSIKKEIFVIQHSMGQDTRLEHDCRFSPPSEPPRVCNKTCTIRADPSSTKQNAGGSSTDLGGAAAPVRTSSCTKEEVDAILIQCARLSRSSSPMPASASCASRKYSGSKRSYDFDDGDKNEYAIKDGSDGADIENDSEKRYCRQSHRQSRASPSPHGRRRTPSRERDQQGSGSRERGSHGSERRKSCSPRRRSENPPKSTSDVANGSNATNRPGKMVPVPASVSSLMMDKINNEDKTATITTTKRVSVKRNVSDGVMGSKGAASPRSQSPAKANHLNIKVFNENQNAPSHQQPSLSRNSSRKAEQSPQRRKPMNEIANSNSLTLQQLPQQPPNKTSTNLGCQKPKVQEIHNNNSQKNNNKNNNRRIASSAISQETRNSSSTTCRASQDKRITGDQHQYVEANEPTGLKPKTNCVESMKIALGVDSLKTQALTRSRSSRRSWDLDVNPETQPNHASSYATVLLEDIQNFHQKNNTSSSPISLPPCVTKACSIVEAVADLNSSTSSNLSCDDKITSSLDQSNRNYNISNGIKREVEARDPFIESELVVCDDLMEPSLHKYVTLRRGTVEGRETEEQESSGSNSFIGVQQHWGSPREPNSADSTDCRNLRSKTSEEQLSQLGFQRRALSESGPDVENAPRRFSAKQGDSDRQQTRVASSRVGNVRT